MNVIVKLLCGVWAQASTRAGGQEANGAGEAGCGGQGGGRGRTKGQRVGHAQAGRSQARGVGTGERDRQSRTRVAGRRGRDKRRGTRATGVGGYQSYLLLCRLPLRSCMTSRACF